jgi:hypothetical protein
MRTELLPQKEGETRGARHLLSGNAYGENAYGPLASFEALGHTFVSRRIADF